MAESLSFSVLGENSDGFLVLDAFSGVFSAWGGWPGRPFVFIVHCSVLVLPLRVHSA